MAIRNGMTDDEVYDILRREPDEVTGSGITIDVYNLEDGTHVYIGRAPTVIYVTHDTGTRWYDLTEEGR